MRLETRNWLRYWFPALAWAALVFFFSTTTFSAERTGHVLRHVLEWLVGKITESTFDSMQLLARKSAHVVVYGTLSALWFRAQRGPRSGWQSSWTLLAVMVSLLVAIADEYHQSFDPSRTGTPWDVVLDTFAALLVQAAIAFSARRRPPAPA